jgi:hypothetical protein
MTISVKPRRPRSAKSRQGGCRGASLRAHDRQQSRKPRHDAAWRLPTGRRAARRLVARSFAHNGREILQAGRTGRARRPRASPERGREAAIAWDAVAIVTPGRPAAVPRSRCWPMQGLKGATQPRSSRSALQRSTCTGWCARGSPARTPSVRPLKGECSTCRACGSPRRGGKCWQRRRRPALPHEDVSLHNRQDALQRQNIARRE